MTEFIMIIEKAKGNYSAFCPDVVGCITTGKTIEETMANMKEALELHLGEEDIWPEAHDIKYLANNNHFKEIATEWWVTKIKMEH